MRIIVNAASKYDIRFGWCHISRNGQLPDVICSTTLRPVGGIKILYVLTEGSHGVGLCRYEELLNFGMIRSCGQRSFGMISRTPSSVVQTSGLNSGFSLIS